MKQSEGTLVAHPEKGEVSFLSLRPRGSVAAVVLGHGAGAGMRHATMEAIAHGLAAKKIASFRYQFPFMERGGGRDALAVSMSTIVEACRVARKTLPRLPQFAAGHSFGGRMTSHAAAEGLLPNVKGLIFYAFPLHMPKKVSDARAEHLPDIGHPMLFLSGSRDAMMTRALFDPVLEKIGRKAKFHELETADHGYKILKRTRTHPEDIFEEMTRVSAEWIVSKI